MKKSPLFADHVTNGATMDHFTGWTLPAHFSSPADDLSQITTNAGIIDLCRTSLLTLSGDATRRWCHGMFTNDVKSLESGQGHRAAMCDDRGRVLGLLDLYCIDNERFFVVLDGVDAEWFIGHYKMFLYLDDIEVTHHNGPEAEPEQSLALVSVQGPSANTVLQQMGLPIPDGDHQHTDLSSESGVGLRIMQKKRSGAGGFDLAVPIESLSNINAALLAAGGNPVGEEAAETARMLAGVAKWPQDGSDKSMIAELNLVDECVSFKKGCYVGQEAINRLDSRGQIQKRLTGVRFSSDDAPPIGAEVLLEGKVVGTLSSVSTSTKCLVALGTIRRSAWESGTKVSIRFGDRQQPGTISDLPFSE